MRCIWKMNFNLLPAVVLCRLRLLCLRARRRVSRRDGTAAGRGGLHARAKEKQRADRCDQRLLLADRHRGVSLCDLRTGRHDAGSQLVHLGGRRRPFRRDHGDRRRGDKEKQIKSQMPRCLTEGHLYGIIITNVL